MKVRRWRVVLTDFDKLNFLTTSQVQKLYYGTPYDMKNHRNVHRILSDMKKEGLINAKRIHENVYFITRKGQSEIGSKSRIIPISRNLEHYLMRNDVYIHFKPEFWSTEKRVEFYNKVIIPDAIFKKGTTHYVLEVDFTQDMIDNKKKIQLYKEFKESKQYKVFPILLFITTTEYRQKQLKAWLDGIKSEVLLYNDIR